MRLSNIQEEDSIWRKLDLNYSGENNYASFFPSKSNTHAYPAKAVPDMVSDLLNHLKKEHDVKSVLDPFLGSGTTALETKYLGLDFYGSDLNPLSILIARTKVLTLTNSTYMIKTILEFVDNLQKEYKNGTPIVLTTFPNIGYWFKEENIKELSYIKEKINIFLKGKGKKNLENYALILLNAFSSSIRTCSLTRNGEFKLYRMSPNDIENFEISAIETFQKNVSGLLEMLIKVNKAYKIDSKIQIELDNAKNLSFIKNNKVDLILTSPPYGDSKSTVAYGQFSRLSLQWMSDLLKKYLNINVYADDCDEYLLGGKKSDLKVQEDKILSQSITFRNLLKEMDRVVDKEVEKFNLMRLNLELLQKKIEAQCFIKKEHIFEDIYELLKERIRLDYYREFNKKATLSRKEIKVISNQKTSDFMADVFDKDNHPKQLDNLKILEEKLKLVMETIRRKISYVPKRKEEVFNFFRDLYQVVIATDRALNINGIQAWIVGHRTVLGKVNINMRDILNDWFHEMGYEKVTDLTREYSFKRLPHHINSTVNRNEQITTMMQEYILIVKKK